MKKSSIFFISILFALFFTGCKYDFILPEEVPVITTPPTFAADVAPIFSNANKCTACHNTGGQVPDLSAAKAYAAIVPGLINATAPAQSLIYSYPLATSSTHAWKKYSVGEAAIILAWITDGAKKN